MGWNSLKTACVALGISCAAGPAAAACLSPDDLVPDLDARDAIFAFRDVELPESAYLGMIAVSARSNGRSDIHMWPELPNGGVSERHFCGNVSLQPIGETADGFSRQLAIGLERGVDYEAAYPEFFDRIAATGQLVRLPAGRYRVVRFEGKAPLAGARDYAAAARGSEGCDGHIAAGVNTIVFPLC